MPVVQLYRENGFEARQALPFPLCFSSVGRGQGYFIGIWSCSAIRLGFADRQWGFVPRVGSGPKDCPEFAMVLAFVLVFHLVAGKNQGQFVPMGRTQPVPMVWKKQNLLCSRSKSEASVFVKPIITLFLPQ
jgi:hypothetical protein